MVRLFLNNRIQCVSVNNCLSTPLPVISGVPQGSILGPLLFLIYINDLPLAVTSSKLLLFADDAKCYKTIHNLPNIHSLQLDLDSLTNWSHTNHLFFKTSKCNSIRFKPNSGALDEDPYRIDNCEVSKKFLIVILGSFSQQTCHGHVIMSTLSAKLTGPLVYYGVPLNVQIQSQPRKLYIYILLDHVYCTVPLYGDLTRFNMLCFWKEYNAKLVNLFLMIIQ